MRHRIVVAFALAALLTAAERPVPPTGVPIPDADRAELEGGIEKLTAAAERVKDHALAPDVLIFRDAVRFALTHSEFFKADEIGKAKTLLARGLERAESLSNGQAPWASATGLVVRGYRSKIDGSIQPYGLVIPESWSAKSPHRWRLDAWFHGRNETLSEVNFLSERMSRVGEFAPANTIMLHLYGRFCNANKFAGEVDLFEALDSVKRHYAIDENRIAVRGFSMGGAAAWQFGAHYAGSWAAVAPGAGFSETAEFLKVFQNEAVKPTWWEQKLWRMYDATQYAANFYNVPLVAYSGEIDRQKQAADIMAAYLEKEGIRMTHIIGPQTPHRYHPDSKIEIDKRLDAIMVRGRDQYPKRLRFTTYTLAYNRMKWLVVDSMMEHWEKAIVDAEVGDREVRLKMRNVDAFTLDFGAGGAPFDRGVPISITVDALTVQAPGVMSDGSWRVALRKDGAQWRVTGEGAGPMGIHKRHGLQGPIDDAFRDSFLIVAPTGEPLFAGVAERIITEQSRAIVEWRRHFRGDARVKRDTEVTDADIASSNLVLWGDPGSNKVLARMMEKLPLTWSGDAVVMGREKFAAATAYPVLVYPNPLNPARYVVLNSGFTFREYDYLNNARQVPKLPDWAVVDVSTPADGQWPGKVASAGFFDEKWQWKGR